MKIIIIGAGLSGLSTAIALRKYLSSEQATSLEIKIYDKRPPDMRNMGAGISLKANGMGVLRDLDSLLRDKVYNSGFPTTHFTWKTAGDAVLGRQYEDLLPISRPILVKILQEHLPEGAVTYKIVSRVITQQGQRPKVEFEDGSPVEVADLIVGADGVGSRVRRDLLGDSEKYRPKYL